MVKEEYQKACKENTMTKIGDVQDSSASERYEKVKGAVMQAAAEVPHITPTAANDVQLLQVNQLFHHKTLPSTQERSSALGLLSDPITRSIQSPWRPEGLAPAQGDRLDDSSTAASDHIEALRETPVRWADDEEACCLQCSL